MRAVGLVTVVVCSLAASAGAVAGDGFPLIDAINQAVQTNPGVGEAAANRRATETELRQSQSTLLPQVRLESRAGREKFDYRNVPTLGNGAWHNANAASVYVRQLLLDGFTSINEIWRQAARVDAAAYRVRERSELIALDAAEAYIDVVRYSQLIAIANENLAAHRRIQENVEARFQGGRAGEGDLEQVRERVFGAEAALAQFRQQYDEAKGTFRKVIGIEPYNLRKPGRLHALPGSRDESLAVALRHNPTIQAAQADRDAAKHAFDATAGSFLPTISLEGRGLYAVNTDAQFGARNDASGFVVASWDIFRGGQDSWRRAEMAERYGEQTMRHARLQRDAFESIDKAWSARTLTSARITALVQQIASDRKVIAAYQKEYELGQRSLIDLLNAQNQLFNGLVSLESVRAVAVFADYQLLAAMGQLLAYLQAPHPVDAEPLDSKPFGLIPTRLAPILLKLPQPGSEPLNISPARSGGVFPGGSASTATLASARPAGNMEAGLFAARWPTSRAPSLGGWLAAVAGGAPQNQPAEAPDFTPSWPRLPAWTAWAKVN
jgi:outer membrane protein, adhesin transport system